MCFCIFLSPWQCEKHKCNVAADWTAPVAARPIAARLTKTNRNQKRVSFQNVCTNQSIRNFHQFLLSFLLKYTHQNYLSLLFFFYMTFFLVGNLGDIFFNLIWFVCLCNIGIWFESRCPRQGREIRNGRVQPVAILFPSPRCPSSISINKFKSFFFPNFFFFFFSFVCVCVEINTNNSEKN